MWNLSSYSTLIILTYNVFEYDLVLFLSATFDRIAEINFNLDADDNSVSIILFLIFLFSNINILVTEFKCLSVSRPMRLLLKPAVRREYASLMMLKRKRTFGRRRR